jgi:hypothetical protein
MIHTVREHDESPVRVRARSVSLEGNLDVPERARGVVLFAHGSGSGRHSRRNRFVTRQTGGTRSTSRRSTRRCLGASTRGWRGAWAEARRSTRN